MHISNWTLETLKFINTIVWISAIKVGIPHRIRLSYYKRSFHTIEHIIYDDILTMCIKIRVKAG
jgi:hypothetical protein